MGLHYWIHMNLAKIQSFRQIGKRLRHAREARGLSLPSIASTSGLKIQELVRIENGELLGFKQAPENTLSNAEVYAKVLDLELTAISSQSPSELSDPNETFIPVFLRKKSVVQF